MFGRTILFLSMTAAVSAGGYYTLQQTTPSIARSIHALLHNNLLGWDQEACESNPQGCLTNRYLVLQGLERQVDTSIRAIRGQKERVNTLVRDQEDLSTRNEAFLNQGKALYKLHSAEQNQPVSFAGKTYPNSAALKQQLSLLYAEKMGISKNAQNAVVLEKKLSVKLDSLMVQAGDITLAKRMIPAQLELVRANNALSDFGENIDMINGVISGSESGIAETDQLIRTTRDLSTASIELSPSLPKLSGEFEDFLSK